MKKFLRSKFGRAVNLDSLLGSSRRWLLLVALASPALIAALSIQGCEESKPTPATTGSPAGGARSARTTPTPPPAAADALELVFPYGSEKKLWLEDVTKRFNESQQKTDSGKPIVVKLLAMGSGETVEEPLSERLKAHLISPASGAFIKLANARSQASTGGPLVESTQDLVLSPVVIAMWKPMAEALGWPNKPIGWSEIINLTKSEQGWASYGFPQWGRSKFGHTHPNQSNSGLMTLVLLAYDFHEKNAGLTLADITEPKFSQWANKLQRAVTGLSNSTGKMMEEMVQRGPSTYDVLLVYEANAIDYVKNAEGRWGKLRVVYPERNAWNDNPYYILKSASKQEAAGAQTFLDFLMSGRVQVQALVHGFRPANVAVPIKAPESAFTTMESYGLRVDLSGVCEQPAPEVINNLLIGWQRNRSN